MKSYVHGDSLVLQEFRDGDRGLRPSFQEILSLVDTADPAWPVIAGLLREMRTAGIEIDARACEIAVKLGSYRLTLADGRHQRERVQPHASQPPPPGSIVYYLRIGGLIKIGTTIDPLRRFMALRPEEVLAFEPGTAIEETTRHHQFGHLRCQGEYFQAAPELLAHIAAMRERHGEPDPAWLPAISRSQRRPTWPPGLSVPSSAEVITAAEAEAKFGVKPRTVRVWATRGKIARVGINGDGRVVYYTEHIRAVLATRHETPAN